MQPVQRGVRLANSETQEEASGDEEPSTEAERRRERTVRIARRAGYVLFLGGGLVLFTTLVVGVVGGITDQRVWDPYTGEPYYGAECLDEARQLIEEASAYDRVEPPWENRYHRWVSGCKERHPDVFQMLDQTRRSIRNGETAESARGDHSNRAGSNTEK